MLNRSIKVSNHAHERYRERYGVSLNEHAVVVALSRAFNCRGGRDIILHGEPFLFINQGSVAIVKYNSSELVVLTYLAPIETNPIDYVRREHRVWKVLSIYYGRTTFWMSDEQLTSGWYEVPVACHSDKE